MFNGFKGKPFYLSIIGKSFCNKLFSVESTFLIHTSGQRKWFIVE